MKIGATYCNKILIIQLEKKQWIEKKKWRKRIDRKIAWFNDYDDFEKIE